jgi:hypothetical protein
VSGFFLFASVSGFFFGSGFGWIMTYQSSVSSSLFFLIHSSPQQMQFEVGYFASENIYL